MRSHRLNALFFLLPATLVTGAAYGTECARQSIAALQGLTAGSSDARVNQYRTALAGGGAPACTTGGCSLLSADLEKFLRARGFSDLRIDGVDTVPMFQNGQSINVPRMHRFLRDRATGKDIILDSTYLQFLGGAAHPPELPEIFVGRKAELQALFSRYAAHFTPFPDLNFKGGANYSTREFIEGVYGDHVRAYDHPLISPPTAKKSWPSAGTDLTGRDVYLDAHGKPVLGNGEAMREFWTTTGQVVAGGGRSKRFYDGAVLELETIEYPDRIEKIFFHLDGTSEKEVEPK